MKKNVFIALFLVLSMLISLIGCNETGSSSTGDSGSGDSGSGDSGSGDSGSGDSGTGDSGTGDSGTGDSGTGDSGTGDSGSGDNQGASTNKIIALLRELLEDYECNPYAFIPEPMLPAYEENLVELGDCVTDYSDFVNVSDIVSGGFGDQWKMVLDNLTESMRFFNALSVVEGIATTSVSVFQNYLDENPAETAQHSFMSGIYSVTIHYDGESISYVLDYTVGGVATQIAMEMEEETKEKTVRIQLGDANALTYKISDDAYEFAIKYLGVRRAYFSVAKDEDGNVEGHINEFLTVSGVGLKSAADFYITDDYVSVVGNKAGGMVGFTGYITELYGTESGRMIGYEVKEELSSIVYNTLWFDLKDYSGINSIKYREASDDVTAAFFVNGKTAEWASKKVGGLSLKALSRRFDIEFRTQYFYTYDAQNDKYLELAVEVPMLFVQEEYVDDLSQNIKDTNGVDGGLTISVTDFDKLLSDYDTLIDIFVENKETVTEEFIVSYIGDKKTFEE